MKRVPNPRKITISKEHELGILAVAYTQRDEKLVGWYKYKDKYYRYVATLFGVEYYAEDEYSDDFEGEELDDKITELPQTPKARK